MNSSKRTIVAVVLAAVAAIGHGGDAVAVSDEEVVGAGVLSECALDLSEVWDKRNLNDEPILWSSLGWARVAEPESGKTVTLSEGDSQTLAVGLKGHRRTFVWAPGEATKPVYNIRHTVANGSPFDTLNAYFSFENYVQGAPSAADVHAAIGFGGGTGLNYYIANDAVNWWGLAGGPGEGIAAPHGASVFTFTVEGHGTFFFDYTLVGGIWTVKVDGVAVRTLDAAAAWTGTEFSVDGALVTHVIEFEAELSNGDSAALRNVRWVDAECCFGGGQGGVGAVDLRTNEVLVVKRVKELLPFAWSSVNFTGVIEVGPSVAEKIDPDSVARVRVVQMTGEGDDLSRWTTEVSGTEEVLISKKSGEGLVKWLGAKAGVWKAEFTILTGDNQVHIEKRILDMRKYVGPGLVFFVM